MGTKMEMNRPLPNTTAEAIGFTIPGRSSSLREHSKRTSKQTKRASLEKSRDEIVQRLRGISLGSHEANIRNAISFDLLSVRPRQISRPQTPNSASSASSNAPFSLYRNYRKLLIDDEGPPSGQASPKIKTFRATDIPDPRNSPDINAHPAHSLPESPIDPPLASPFIPVPNAQIPRSLPGYISEPQVEKPANIPVPASFSSKHTEDTTVNVTQSPAVTHETIHRHTEHIMQEQITRDIHYHDSYTYIQPIKQTVYAPAQHYATGLDGKIIRIPDALGESLDMVKEREPSKSVAGMGWE
jgi:hypothetical protein